MLTAGWLMSYRRKDYCTQTAKEKELSREIRARVMVWWWCVATNFTLWLRKKHVAHPSVLKSSLQLNLYAHSLLITCLF